MTTPLQEARVMVQKARAALSAGDRRAARQYAEKAAKLAPQLEDAWLILAAVAGPRLGLDYIRKALQVNPESPRARRGMEWVLRDLQESEGVAGDTQRSPAVRTGATQQARVAVRRQAVAGRRKRAGLLLPLVMLSAGCMILGLASWTAMTSPLVASLIAQPVLASEPTRAPQWAQVSIPRSTYTAPAQIAGDLAEVSPTPAAQATPGAGETDPPAGLSADPATALPTEAGLEIPTAEPTWSGSLSMEYVEDTPTPEAPAEAPPTPTQPTPGGSMPSGTRWIDVNLTQQMVYAYAGDTVVNSFLASTGVWQTPTVTGKYKIWIKVPIQDMSGPDYYLPDVPYVMYFYKDYGFHGTYWHNNFGTPMSHGCVNLSIPDAEWLYGFASVGTVVNVHY